MNAHASQLSSDLTHFDHLDPETAVSGFRKGPVLSERQPKNSPAPDLRSVEERQHGLVQFLILVVMLILGGIVVLSRLDAPALAIPALALCALATCLYTAFQDRKLRQLHASLVQNLSTKEKVMGRMGDRLRAETARSDELGSRLDDLTRLYRAIASVNSVSDPEASYEAVVRAAMRLVDADTGSLMLVEGKVLTLRSAVGLPDVVLANHPTRDVGDGVSGWVALNATAVLLKGEAEDDSRFNDPIPDTGFRCSLCVPLIHAHHVLGVLNLGIHEDISSGDSARTLDDADQSLASIFAQHAAVTVLNARLLERHTA